MRKALFLLLLLPQVLAAQAVLTVAPQQCVWRAGDDLHWASPLLDESHWQPYTAWKLDPHENRIWIRCHADLSSLRNISDPALQLALNAGYQLYLNGKLIGAIGNVQTGVYSEDSFKTFPLAPADLVTQPALVAVRITYRSIDETDPLQIFAAGQTRLRDRRDHEVVQGILGYLPVAVCFSIIGVIGFMMFGLYLNDRSRLELLMLALVCGCLAVVRLDELCSYIQVPYSSTTYQLLYGVGQVMFVPYVFFIFRLARRPIPWLFRIATLVACSYPAEIFFLEILPPGPSLRFGAAFNSFMPVDLVFGSLITFSSFVAFWPWKGIAPRMRPVAVCCMLWGAADTVWFGAVIAWELTAAGRVFFRHWADSLLETRGMATVALLIALLALLFRDQRRVAEERAQFAGEIASAREIQQYLIPSQLPQIPGLAVESVYHPSREVGGDFFQVLPHARDGSTLIVVGDVAGKGLQAGMLAALIVGAIRTAAKFTTEPDEILALLNERLQGRGLVTCLALRIEQDGSAALANAGHLPPYRNARELPMDGALPLGAVPGIVFPAMRFQLEPGETLMLMSDGIAEAQNADGTLFGFDRIGEMLRGKATAAGLAAAAQSFGQEDDITVLTLTFAGAALASAGAVHA